MLANGFPRASSGRLSILISALEPVVLVQITGGSQRLIVEADCAGNLFQFLAKCMDCLQLGRRGGNLILGCLNELLLAAVQQATDLSPDHQTRTDGEGRGRAL